jgi:hypothetical protein
MSDGKTVYQHEPWENLWGLLPCGVRPVEWAKGDDPWNGAKFELESGRTIAVRRD